MNSICKVKDCNRIANDSNPFLISMWKHLVNGWVPEKVSKEEYDKVKNNKDSYSEYFVGWVGFNCSYSGKFFGGYAGVTKTKDGIRDYQEEAIKNVLKQVVDMKDVVFSNKNYSEMDIPKNSIVYCDPPYENTTKYFNNFDHEKFWNWCREISRDNFVYISEYNAPNDFECVWEKKVSSSLSANGFVGVIK